MPCTHLCRWLALLSVVAAAGIVWITSAIPPADTGKTSPFGFSTSSEGLPEAAVDSWHATVLIESQHLGRPAWHEQRGSGVVVEVDEERQVAVIVTNAHIVTCRDAACLVRVGFDDPEVRGGTRWCGAAEVVSRNSARDLAFIEAGIPDTAEACAARFCSANCVETGLDPVLSIGWPDLTTREKWEVQPPPNFHDHVKRYSRGLLLRRLKGYRLRALTHGPSNRMRVVFHSTDVLPGSSGGPLVNPRGEVIAINALVMSDLAEPDFRHVCTGGNPHNPGDCFGVAIASKEVIDEYERVYGSRLAFVDCTAKETGAG